MSCNDYITPFVLPTGPSVTGPAGPQGEQGPAGESIVGPPGPPGANANPKVNKYSFQTNGNDSTYYLSLAQFTFFENENLASNQLTDYIISVKQFIVDPNNLANSYWQDITDECAIQISSATSFMSITFPTTYSNVSLYRITIIG